MTDSGELLGMPSGLLGLATALVGIPSVSHEEQIIADAVESALRLCPWLEVERVGDNVVARTHHGHATRVLLGGHLDTVPPVDGNDAPRLEGDTLYGVGAADMKGGLAVFLHLAGLLSDAAVDLTWLFYVCEEVEQRYNGLHHLWRERPDLLAADVAILGEPTGGVVEAGCQGTLRIEVGLAGARAHTARPWTGRNAIHRLGGVLDAIETVDLRQPVLDGCTYREALQAVRVEGGVAANVVPDWASLVLNHRFAPDRTADEAEAHLRAHFAPVLSEQGDTWARIDAANGAPPALTHPVLAALVDASGAPPRAKLGWTDVASFSAHGIPAANFGPGDPLLAHTPGEFVTADELHAAADALRRLLDDGPA